MGAEELLGAATPAASALGPIGAGIGALLSGATGIMGSRRAKRRAKKQRREEQARLDEFRRRAEEDKRRSMSRQGEENAAVGREGLNADRLVALAGVPGERQLGDIGRAESEANSAYKYATKNARLQTLQSLIGSGAGALGSLYQGGLFGGDGPDLEQIPAENRALMNVGRFMPVGMSGRRSALTGRLSRAR